MVTRISIFRKSRRQLHDKYNISNYRQVEACDVNKSRNYFKFYVKSSNLQKMYIVHHMYLMYRMILEYDVTTQDVEPFRLPLPPFSLKPQRMTFSMGGNFSVNKFVCIDFSVIGQSH